MYDPKMLEKAIKASTDLAPVEEAFQACEETKKKVADVRCRTHPDRRWNGAIVPEGPMCQECFEKR